MPGLYNKVCSEIYSYNCEGASSIVHTNIIRLFEAIIWVIEIYLLCLTLIFFFLIKWWMFSNYLCFVNITSIYSNWFWTQKQFNSQKIRLGINWIWSKMCFIARFLFLQNLIIRAHVSKSFPRIDRELCGLNLFSYKIDEMYFVKLQENISCRTLSIFLLDYQDGTNKFIEKLNWPRELLSYVGCVLKIFLSILFKFHGP